MRLKKLIDNRQIILAISYQPIKRSLTVTIVTVVKLTNVTILNDFVIQRSVLGVGE